MTNVNVNVTQSMNRSPGCGGFVAVFVLLIFVLASWKFALLIAGTMAVAVWFEVAKRRKAGPR